MTSQCHSRACETWTISPASPLLRPTVAQAALTWDCVISPMISGERELKRDLGVCELPLSVCAKTKLEQQTHRRDMTKRFFWRSCYAEAEQNAGVRFPSAAPAWNFPHRSTRSHCCHCLPVNGESTPRKNKARAGRCADDATRWGCPSFGGGVALCPLIVRCADSCQEMETASGGVKRLKLLFYVYCRRTGWKRPRFSFVRLSPWKTFEFMAFSSLFLAPREVLRERCDCLRCWNNITSGIMCI